jgi:hypothetical protein
LQAWTDADRELCGEDDVDKHEASVIDRALGSGVPLGRIVASSSSSSSSSAAATAEECVDEAVLRATLVPDEDASAGMPEEHKVHAGNCLDRAADLWEKSLARSVEALCDRQSVLAAGTPVGGTGVRKELSIVVASDRFSGSEIKSVILADWSSDYRSSASSRRGRRVRLDGNFCAVWPRVGIGAEDMSSFPVVHPAIGVSLRMARENRPRVPDQIVRLIDIWTTLENRKAVYTLVLASIPIPPLDILQWQLRSVPKWPHNRLMRFRGLRGAGSFLHMCSGRYACQ